MVQSACCLPTGCRSLDDLLQGPCQPFKVIHHTTFSFMYGNYECLFGRWLHDWRDHGAVWPIRRRQISDLPRSCRKSGPVVMLSASLREPRNCYGSPFFNWACHTSAECISRPRQRVRRDRCLPGQRIFLFCPPP